MKLEEVKTKYLTNTSWRRNLDVLATALFCPKLSYSQIGRRFEISRQRVHQILKREKDRIQGGYGTFNLAGEAFLLCHMKDDLVDDGFGTAASAVCDRCGERAVYIVRPGDIRCANCEKIDFEAREKDRIGG